MRQVYLLSGHLITRDDWPMFTSLTSNSVAYVFSNQFRVTPNDIVYVSTTDLGRLNRVIDQVSPALDLINLTNTAETNLRDLVDLNE